MRILVDGVQIDGWEWSPGYFLPNTIEDNIYYTYAVDGNVLAVQGVSDTFKPIAMYFSGFKYTGSEVQVPAILLKRLAFQGAAMIRFLKSDTLQPVVIEGRKTLTIQSEENVGLRLKLTIEGAFFADGTQMKYFNLDPYDSASFEIVAVEPSLVRVQVAVTSHF